MLLLGTPDQAKVQMLNVYLEVSSELQDLLGLSGTGCLRRKVCASIIYTCPNAYFEPVRRRVLSRPQSLDICTGQAQARARGRLLAIGTPPASVTPRFCQYLPIAADRGWPEEQSCVAGEFVCRRARECRAQVTASMGSASVLLTPSKTCACPCKQRFMKYMREHHVAVECSCA